MSLDLGPAVEEAARTWWTRSAEPTDGRAWAELPPLVQHAVREHVLPLVAAVAPVLLAELDSEVIDVAHLTHQREWSRETFGPGPRTAGVLDHIGKELSEIAAEPTDLGEWVDVIILAFDGAWRAGHEPEQIIAAIKGKQARNEARTWPDWRTADRDKAIEHDRTGEQA